VLLPSSSEARPFSLAAKNHEHGIKHSNISASTPSFHINWLIRKEKSTTSPSDAKDNDDYDKVDLRDIHKLSFHAGRLTTYRRLLPVPELRCVGGSVCTGEYPDLLPDRVTCYNDFATRNFIRWDCHALKMSINVRFGDTKLDCEGYSYKDDPYILRGSCGLQYELDFVDSSEKGGSDKKRDKKAPFSAPNNANHTSSFKGFYNIRPAEVFSLVGTVFVIGILVFAAILVFGSLQSRRQARQAELDEEEDEVIVEPLLSTEPKYRRTSQ